MKDAAGNWKTVIEDMGMPVRQAEDHRGRPDRQVPLRLARGPHRHQPLRLLGRNLPERRHDAPPDAHLTRDARSTPPICISAASPSRRFDPERKQPEQFDYSTVSFTSMWNPTPGLYTRYGDVSRRCSPSPTTGWSSWVRATRSACASAPPVCRPLPPGWKRDFLLLVDGWAKDADANTAFSQSVLPLPFHAMSRYPYPAAEHFPDDAAHAQYQREYLTRPALRLIRPLAPQSAESRR